MTFFSACKTSGSLIYTRHKTAGWFLIQVKEIARGWSKLLIAEKRSRAVTEGAGFLMFVRMKDEEK